MNQESSFTIAGVLEQVSHAVEFVSEIARQAGLNEQAVYHCQLAVDEACTNIIEHGYTSNGLNGVIDIICQVHPSSFTIIVGDDSPAYNPLSQTDPNPMASLEERNIGGWGVFFIKKVMSQVSYTYEGRNYLIMTKQIEQP